MCRLLYPAGLNIDYYPTNFVPRAGVLYYIDYECNAYEEQWDFVHWGVQYLAGSGAEGKRLKENRPKAALHSISADMCKM